MMACVEPWECKQLGKGLMYVLRCLKVWMSVKYVLVNNKKWDSNHHTY